MAYDQLATPTPFVGGPLSLVGSTPYILQSIREAAASTGSGAAQGLYGGVDPNAGTGGIPPALAAALEAAAKGASPGNQRQQDIQQGLYQSSVSGELGALTGWAQGTPVAHEFIGRDGNPKVYLGEHDVMVQTKDQKHTISDSQDAKGDYLTGGIVESETSKKKKVSKDRVTTLTEATNLPYTWSQKKIQETMAKMRSAGINVTTFDQLNQTWTALTQRAAMTFALSGGEQKVTPWDVLEMNKSEAQSAGTLVNYQNGVQKSRSKSVFDISEGEAFSVLQSQLTQMLGRAPSDEEVRDFTHNVNQQAAANPAITETVSHYKNGRIVNQTTDPIQAGYNGADAQKQAYDDARAAPDYAEYQSATTLFNAAQSALGAIGSV